MTPHDNNKHNTNTKHDNVNINIDHNISQDNKSEQPIKEVKSQEQIKDEVIKNAQNKYNISQKEVMQHHEKEVNDKTQKEVQKQDTNQTPVQNKSSQNMNELPETGQNNNQSGLIASIITLLGGISLFARRKNKKEKE